MSEQATFDASYSAPQRVGESVPIDEAISHIDILLPHASETYMDGFRWVNVLHKALRIHRIDEQALLLSDLSSIEGDHSLQAPVYGEEKDMPTVVMDLADGETAIYGRDHNPSNLDILSDRLVSREHLKITPHFGKAGLVLAFRDDISTNGSGLTVVRHRLDTLLPDSLFVA